MSRILSILLDLRFQVECTMRDGGCIPSVYPIPPESFKVEVEEGNATVTTEGGLPEGVKQTGLVKLDNSTVRPRF